MPIVLSNEEEERRRLINVGLQTMNNDNNNNNNSRSNDNFHNSTSHSQQHIYYNNNSNSRKNSSFGVERREFHHQEFLIATNAGRGANGDNNNSHMSVRNAALHSDRYSHSHNSIAGFGFGCSSLPPPPPNNNTNSQHQQQQQQQQKKRRVKQLFLLSTLSFIVMLVLDGLIQFTDLSTKVEISVIEAKESVREGLEEVKENVEELVERRLIDTSTTTTGGDDYEGGERGSRRSAGGGGFLRRLLNSLLDDDNENDNISNVVLSHHHYEMNAQQEEQVDTNWLSRNDVTVVHGGNNIDMAVEDGGDNTNIIKDNNNNLRLRPNSGNQEERTLLINEPLILPDERSHTVGLDPFEAVGNDKYVDQGQKNNTLMTDQTNQRKRKLLHTLPLLPKHALQHRTRRELMTAQLPIPHHLQEGVEDEMYHVNNAHRRRRMYPMLHENGVDIVDARRQSGVDGGGQQRRVQEEEEEDSEEITNFEIGSLYQGYGTHYVDIWVGTPPQRQTVIVDTGSSITAFPCSGCEHCGDNPATGEQYHTDVEFNTDASDTYEEKACKRGSLAAGRQQHKADPGIPCDLGSCTIMANSGMNKCQVAVAYAEGSSWAALEGSDVVYPAGPHDRALESKEEMEEAGVGLGMEDVSEENEFDWMDFRLKFGCQSKVTGLFRSQLEDGIMGMDNRKGAFWLQLHEHYKANGYTPSDDKDDEPDFDPAQFSLCYDRQPLSQDLKSGVGSGALTLGGTDPTMHSTDMVYAANLTPLMGWYALRIKGMFLRTNGGTLSEPSANDAQYIRVTADESVLNGQSSQDKGVILDSGTTDTYLSSLLSEPFRAAWKEAVGENGPHYDTNPRKMTPQEVQNLPTVLIVLQGHELGNDHNKDAIGLTRAHPAMFDSRRSLLTLDTGSATSSAQTTTAKDLPAISKTDVVIAVPPGHYMEESHTEPGTYTARLYFSERYGSQSILGSNVMMGHDILFDNSRGRVGIAESNCDYESYVEERDDRRRQAEEQELAQEQAQGEKDQKMEENAEPQAEENIDTDLAASGWA